LSNGIVWFGFSFKRRKKNAAFWVRLKKKTQRKKREKRASEKKAAFRVK
jgi:hypothetical protein